MWSSPRNPQRNPKPSASEVSGSKWNEASFSRSFSSASRSCGYSLPSTGYSPAKTIGFISLKPGNGSRAGRPASVIVSPIFASLTVLIPAKMNPTSPTPSSSTGIGLGEKVPTCSTWYSCPSCMNLIFMPARTTPSITRVRMMTPR